MERYTKLIFLKFDLLLMYRLRSCNKLNWIEKRYYNRFEKKFNLCNEHMDALYISFINGDSIKETQEISYRYLRLIDNA